MCCCKATTLCVVLCKGFCWRDKSTVRAAWLIGTYWHLGADADLKLGHKVRREFLGCSNFVLCFSSGDTKNWRAPTKLRGSAVETLKLWKYGNRENNTNDKQRYRLTRKLDTADTVSILLGSQVIALPLGPHWVSGSMLDPVESYFSPVVTLQNLVALIM